MTARSDLPPSSAASDDHPAGEQLVLLKTLLDVPRDQRQPMSREDSRAFLQCSMMDTAAGKDQPVREVAQELRDAPVALNIVLKRIAWGNPETPVRMATLLFLSTLCSTPGRCVLWAFYLVRRTTQLGRAVTIEDLALTDFPDGFPKDEACWEIWDDQKAARHGLKGDNLLDTQMPWVTAATVSSAQGAQL